MTPADTPDLDERPLAGKMSIGFTDLTKTDAYIRVQGFDTVAADKVWLTGIVAKGEGVGATIGGNDPEQLTAVHLSQRFLGFENRERAVQATAVNLFVDVHPAFPFVCARF